MMRDKLLRDAGQRVVRLYENQFNSLHLQPYLIT